MDDFCDTSSSTSSSSSSSRSSSFSKTARRLSQDLSDNFWKSTGRIRRCLSHDYRTYGNVDTGIDKPVTIKAKLRNAMSHWDLRDTSAEDCDEDQNTLTPTRLGFRKRVKKRWCELRSSELFVRSNLFHSEKEGGKHLIDDHDSYTETAVKSLIE